MNKVFSQKLEGAVKSPLDSDAPKSRQPLFLRLSIKEKILFVKRLSLLLKAGVPVAQSVRMLKNQITSKSVLFILNDLSSDVENGQYISTSLGKYKHIFGDFLLNIIRIGEVSGNLHENLLYLSEELKKKQALRRKVVGSLVYPVFVIIATFLITILLTVYVFPKILPILQSLNADLPMTTKALIAISYAVSHFWWAGLLVAAAIGLAGVFLLKKENIKLKFDGYILKFPLLGRLLIFYNVTNICRSLAILLKSDVRIVEAVGITANSTPNLAYKKVLTELAGVVAHGGKVSSVLGQHTKLFPPMVGQMVSVGESTGSLGHSLSYLGEIYEAEVDDLTKNLSTLLEPLLLVLMGLLVGFIAISIITPIYKITSSIRP